MQQHDLNRRLLTQLPDANSLFSGGTQLLPRSVATLFGALRLLANAVVIAFIGLCPAIYPGAPPANCSMENSLEAARPREVTHQPRPNAAAPSLTRYPEVGLQSAAPRRSHP